MKFKKILSVILIFVSLLYTPVFVVHAAPDRYYRITIIGSEGTGKSHLWHNLVGKEYIPRRSVESKRGDFVVNVVPTLSNGRPDHSKPILYKVHYETVDTPGGEEYYSTVRNKYMENSNCFVIVCNLVSEFDKEKYETYISKVIEDINNKVPGVGIILVGTFYDKIFENSFTHPTLGLEMHPSRNYRENFKWLKDNVAEPYGMKFLLVDSKNDKVYDPKLPVGGFGKFMRADERPGWTPESGILSAILKHNPVSYDKLPTSSTIMRLA